MCGFTFTNEGFSVLFRVISFIQSSKAYQNLSDAPCLFTYGSEDPVGSYGKGPAAVRDMLAAEGVPVELKIYENCRHEILNDTSRAETIADILAFVG